MTRSEELFVRAGTVIPGGVNSPVRAFGAVGGTPRFVDRGEGAYVIDVDGNRYVDLVGSWGALLFGHAHPEIVGAACAAAARGTTFGAPTEGEVELAGRIVDALPGGRARPARLQRDGGHDVRGATGACRDRSRPDREVRRLLSRPCRRAAGRRRRQWPRDARDPALPGRDRGLGAATRLTARSTTWTRWTACSTSTATRSPP